MELRNAFGAFATGVTVVSCFDPATGQPHGMTANSFTSVSLDPPLSLVALSNMALTLRLIEEGEYFGVSVLSEEQRELSDVFCGRLQAGDDMVFSTVDEVPLIDGALANFSLQRFQVHRAGDHSLVVGRIRDFWITEGRPLLFYRGGYEQLQGRQAAASLSC